MSYPSHVPAEPMPNPAPAAVLPSPDNSVAESATPLQGQKKGFPIMPNVRNMLVMRSQPRPNHREKHRPRNGPSIDDWEAALVGRRIIAEDADIRKRVGVWTVAEVIFGLRSSVKDSQGVLGRLPREIVEKIEQILQDEEDRTTVRRPDLPANTKFSPGYGTIDWHQVTGRLTVVHDSNWIVQRMRYG